MKIPDRYTFKPVLFIFAMAAFIFYLLYILILTIL